MTAADRSNNLPNMRLVVIALTNGDLESLPEKTRKMIGDSATRYSPLKYADHPHDWIPFCDSRENVRQLLDKANQYLAEEGICITVLARTDEFPREVGDKLSRWFEKPCIYVIDCLAIESNNWYNLITEVDGSTHSDASSGCITPICNCLPKKIRNKCTTLREQSLVHLSSRCADKMTIHFDVTNSTSFIKAIRSIVEHFQVYWLLTVVPPKDIELFVKRLLGVDELHGGPIPTLGK